MATKDTKTTVNFAEKYQEAQMLENSWKQRNGEYPYHTDLLKSIKPLSEAVFPHDQFNSAGYQEAIITSLTSIINPEIGIYDFWDAMGKAGCVSIKITEGHLTFLRADESQISITPFTQPIIFDAHSSFHKLKHKMRTEKIKEAKAQLAHLKSQLQKQIQK